MSTSETVEIELGVCPCGGGNIIQSVTTQDNPWSTADIYQYINCTKCAAEWRLEHRRLVQISSETEYKLARNQELLCRDNLYRVVTPLADEYFKAFAAKTKKAEHEEMVRLGIFNGNYRDFLNRKRGGSPGNICNALKNPDWVTALARAASMNGELDRLKLEYELAKVRTAVAAKTIVRRPLPELKVGA